MKRLFIVFLGLLTFCNIGYAQVVTTAYVTADDTSINQLETNRVALTNGINSFDGSLVISGSIPASALTESANPETRWDEAFNDFVFTGLTIPTSGTLAATTTLGTAYVFGARVVKDPVAKTYTASKWTFVDLSNTGVYTYSETAISAGEPAVTSNSIRIARVSTDGTTVLEVRDDRITSISTSSYKVVEETYAMDTSSSDISYTGAGFTPKAVHILATGTSGALISWGFSDGATHGIIHDDNGDTSLTALKTDTAIVRLDEGASLNQRAVIKSFDEDGLTLTWTRTGATASATVTMEILYMR